MLPQKHRLLKNKEFQNVFQKGKLLKEQFIFLRFLKNNLNFNRFGFVISGKVSKKSVERHKIKRRLREIVRSKLPEIKAGFDIVFLASPEIKGKKYNEMKEMIDKVMSRLNLIKTNG